MWRTLWPGLRDNLLWTAIVTAISLGGAGMVAAISPYIPWPLSLIPTPQLMVFVASFALFAGGLVYGARALLRANAALRGGPTVAEAGAAARAAPADPPQADLLGANAAYLFWLARDDLADPTGVVKAVSVSSSGARADLRQLDNGYAEFTLTIVNAAPFWVEVEKVEGYLACGTAKALKDSPRLTTAPGRGTPIPHGESRDVVLRQHLSDKEAGAVRAQLGDGVLLVNLSGLTLLVKLKMQARPLHTIPNAPETIRPIRLPNAVYVRWPDRFVELGRP
jgi:hypothetical protein